MEQNGRVLGLTGKANDDVLLPNNNQRDTGLDGKDAGVVITNEEGGDNEAWILTEEWHRCHRKHNK